MDQCTMIVYGSDGEGTWYVANPDDVETIVQEHIIGGKKVDSLINEGMKIDLEG